MAPRRKSSAKKRKAEELQNGAGPSAAPAAPAAEEEKSEEELLQEALGMLMGALQNSIDADKANAALMASADASKEGAEAWVEAAMIWLAENQEVEDEGAEMGAAMQQSLLEEEERKKSEKPVVERTGKEIIDHFKASAMLGVLSETMGGDESLAAALDAEAAAEAKKTLVKYLTMEQKCLKWYAVSRGYFDQAAAQGRERVTAAEAEAAAVDPPEGDGGASEGGERPPAAIPPPLIAFLSEQYETLERDVYKRPPSDSELVPGIFAAHVAKEEVVLLE